VIILVARSRSASGSTRGGRLGDRHPRGDPGEQRVRGHLAGIALLTRREATMIALANFIGLPLLFVSTTLLARGQMPHWMQVAAHGNPMDWGVRAAARWCSRERPGARSASTSCSCSSFRP
jgi:hypothetical protein